MRAAMVRARRRSAIASLFWRRRGDGAFSGRESRGATAFLCRWGRSLWFGGDHFGATPLGCLDSIALTPNFAASAAPAFGPSGVQRVSGGLPHLLPISAQPTQRPSGAR